MKKARRICLDCHAERVKEELPALDRRRRRVYKPYRQCPVCGGWRFAFAGMMSNIPYASTRRISLAVSDQPFSS